MRNPKILIFAGSARAASLNGKLAALAGKRLAIRDAEVTHISLKDYPLPIYDGDYEAENGVPANAGKLARLFKEQHGIFMTCPEYNAGITPLLKNTLDWISRYKEPNDPSMAAFRKKVFALGAVSPGRFGGIRGLIGMRTILEVGLGSAVLPQMLSIANGGSAFTDKGDLSEDRVSAQLDSLIDDMLQATGFARG